MRFLKIFFILILFLALIVLELAGWLPKQVSLIFVVSLSFLLRAVLKNQRLERVFVAVVIGGFLLDLYSVFPPGLFILSLLTTFYITKRFLLNWINLNSLAFIFLASLIISLFYQFLILLFGQLFYFLSWSEIKFSFDEFSLFSIAWSVLLNGLLGAIFALAPGLNGEIKLRNSYK